MKMGSAFEKSGYFLLGGLDQSVVGLHCCYLTRSPILLQEVL